MKTYEDCKKKSEKLQIHASEIAKAFDIEIPDTTDLEYFKSKLKDSPTLEEKGLLYDIVPHESGAGKVILEAIEKQAKSDLINTVTQQERWELNHKVPLGSDIGKIILRAILKNATTQIERRQVLFETQGNVERNDLRTEAIKELCLN